MYGAVSVPRAWQGCDRCGNSAAESAVSSCLDGAQAGIQAKRRVNDAERPGVVHRGGDGGLTFGPRQRGLHSVLRIAGISRQTRRTMRPGQIVGHATEAILI